MMARYTLESKGELLNYSTEKLERFRDLTECEERML
jgi:hypothetical protein